MNLHYIKGNKKWIRKPIFYEHGRGFEENKADWAQSEWPGLVRILDGVVTKGFNNEIGFEVR